MLNEPFLDFWKAKLMSRHFRRQFGRGGGPWRQWVGDGDWGGGWVRMRRGGMKYRILELLAERPRHGYDIIRDLEARHEGYRPSPGSIYPTLQMLEDGGFVTSETVDGKRIYTIADAGRRLLESRSADAGDAGADDESQRAPWAELRDSAIKLGAAVMQAARDGDQANIERVRDILDRSRREIYAILAGDTKP
jgi:DNA-binding PadR family transcriptional regulator